MLLVGTAGAGSTRLASAGICAPPAIKFFSLRFRPIVSSPRITARQSAWTEEKAQFLGRITRQFDLDALPQRHLPHR